MSTRRIYAGIGVLALIGGLAACGSSGGGSAAAPTVTQSVVAPAPATTTAAPIIINNNNNPPAPTQTVYVPAAPAVPALTACGEGAYNEEVYAGRDTSCPFALNVEQAYAESRAWWQPGTSEFYAYSPVTGLTYLMTSSSSGDPVVVTGGNNALVEFSVS